MLWLSDSAWENLSREAFSMGWIRQMNTVNAPGVISHNISRYFEALASLEYTDTRPDQFVDTNVWQEGESAHARKVHVSDAALSLLAATAASYRMPPRWYAAMIFNERVTATLSPATYAAVFANQRTSLNNMAAAALEAIGCRYLTPAQYPAAPRDLFKNPPRARITRQQHVYSKYGY